MHLKKCTAILIALVMSLGLAAASEAADMQKKTTLDVRQRSIVTIAAFTASGEIERLKPELAEGLDSGLTVNEVKEVLVQMYAYAGFPRSLGGIWAFMDVMEQRRAQGIEDEVGREASPIPEDLDRDTYGARVRADLAGLDEVPENPAPYQEFSPIIDEFLKEHLFADIFARDILTHQERELATIAALANMTGVNGPLTFHFSAAMNTGLTEGQLHDFITVLADQVDEERAENAGEVLTKVLADRQ
ncbi:carboxymuconolactone decarboxylase family protein [Desulfovibrio oxyclinae]|uniref:carboxymuconolactone decarboxylase family protein n=1 Tax=Desulfovibrio oxyclinae TaxID=63560 RepID=UPI00037FB491|nr:carboxymuconolactone decarboxylase family protein [Desulfovibrio oxyclinae]